MSLIFGGQIKGEGMRCSRCIRPATSSKPRPRLPYFQVGESKYGKPVLDRVITPHTPLDEAAKCALVSMDSTLKSNLSVGLPLDLVVYEANQLPDQTRWSALTRTTPTSAMLHGSWGQKLREVFDSIEDPHVEWRPDHGIAADGGHRHARQAAEEDYHPRREAHDLCPHAGDVSSLPPQGALAPWGGPAALMYAPTFGTSVFFLPSGMLSAP